MSLDTQAVTALSSISLTACFLTEPAASVELELEEVYAGGHGHSDRGATRAAPSPTRRGKTGKRPHSSTHKHRKPNSSSGAYCRNGFRLLLEDFVRCQDASESADSSVSHRPLSRAAVAMLQSSTRSKLMKTLLGPAGMLNSKKAKRGLYHFSDLRNPQCALIWKFLVNAGLVPATLQAAVDPDAATCQVRLASRLPTDCTVNMRKLRQGAYRGCARCDSLAAAISSLA